MLGLLWFLQNDPEAPESDRAPAKELQPPGIEFNDHDHLPSATLRERGPRLPSEYTLTQHDITSKRQPPKRQGDSIAVEDF